MPTGLNAILGKPAADADLDRATAKVFVSYSRKDLTFVDDLERELRLRDIQLLIDRAEIYAFEDWWKRIEGLIGQADTILFVLSPDAVSSEICRKEIAHAAILNKRFAPVVARPVDPSLVPEALSRLNFVFLDDPIARPLALDQLVEALNTDIEWVRRHSEFGTLASRWSSSGRPKSLLLRSPQLDEAEHWVAGRPAHAPVPTADTLALLASSRQESTRRRNLVSLALAAGLVAALTLAGFAFWQRQEAVTQRMIAERQTALAVEREGEARREKEEADRQRATADAQRNRAENLFNSTGRTIVGLIKDIAIGMRSRMLPIATVRDVLTRVERLIDELVRTAPDDPRLRQSQASMLIEFSETYGAAGDRDRQVHFLQRALPIVDTLVAEDASLAYWRAQVHFRLGVVLLTRGEYDAAYARFDEVRAAMAPRVAGQQASIDDVILISNALDGMGDVQAARNDATAALALYQEALNTRRSAATRHPDDETLRSTLAYSLERIGAMAQARGDLQGAMTQYEESRDIRQRLSEGAPDNAEWARNLCRSLDAIAGIQAARGELQTAVATYDRARTIRERLVRLDPENIGVVIELGFSWDKMADVFWKGGQARTAIDFYERSLSIWERAFRREPRSWDLVRYLSSSFWKLALANLEISEKPKACSYLLRGRETWVRFGKASQHEDAVRAAVQGFQDKLTQSGCDEETTQAR